MSEASALLTPLQLNPDLPLRNRVVMAPLTRARAGVERMPNSLMAEYYAQRAEAGLIISEATVISLQGCGWNESPGVYLDTQAEAWSSIVDEVHARGGRMFLQLWHCGRASHSSFQPDGAPPPAPSAIKLNGDYIHTPNGKQPYETPREMSVAEIEQTIADYRAATRRAVHAGFDGVEVHAANGYLIDEFLQSRTNHRTDAYGGDVSKRCRFLEEVLEAVTGEIASDRVGVRLSPNGVFNDMGSPDYRQQFTYLAERLSHAGLAYLHVMDGLAFGFHELGEPMTLPEFRAVFSGPVMANCGYDQASGEAAVAAGHADLVAFGRPFISNPDLVARFRNDWPLAPAAEMDVWYTPGEKGYADFPVYQAFN